MINIEISRYEYKRKKTKNGLFIYSKKNKKDKRLNYFFSNQETKEGIKELFNFFELQCEQLKYRY